VVVDQKKLGVLKLEEAQMPVEEQMELLQMEEDDHRRMVDSQELELQKLGEVQTY